MKQALTIERDVERNGIRLDCVFEGKAFDAEREEVRALRLSGIECSKIADQIGLPLEQVIEDCRKLGLPETGSCHLLLPGGNRERRCPVCGRIIGQSGRGAPRKYCSDECSAEYERKMSEKVIGVFPMFNTGGICVHTIDEAEERVLASINGKDPEEAEAGG